MDLVYNFFKYILYDKLSHYQNYSHFVVTLLQ